MSLQRALRRGSAEDRSDRDIAHAAQRIYHLLLDGHYRCAHTGKLLQVRGDVSKLLQVQELSETDRAILKNYHFLSRRLAGT